MVMDRGFSLLALLCLLLIPNSISAEMKPFNIDNQFTATFPTKPTLLGEVEAKYKDSPIIIRSYASTDENNLIVYNGTVVDYSTAMSKINTEEDIKTILRSHATGNLLAINGKLESYKTRIINGFPSAIFSISFKLQDIKLNKYSVITWLNGYMLSWSVQGSPTRSTLSAKKLFYQYLTNFRITKDTVNTSIEEKSNLGNQIIIRGEIISILNNKIPVKAYKSDDGIMHIQSIRSIFMKITRDDGTILFSTIPEFCLEGKKVKSHIAGGVLEISSPLLY